MNSCFSSRPWAALGLLAASCLSLRADTPPDLAVARRERVELGSLLRPSALLGGMAHIGAGASSSAPDQTRVLHLDPDAPPPVLGAPADLDASRLLPLLGADRRSTLQRVSGHDATLTLVGDDLYIERRTLPPEEHVLSARALWAQLGEAACGLTATQVHYDAARHRWSLAAVADAGQAGAALLVATSEASDPTSGWELQRLHLPAGGSFGALPPTVMRAGAGLRVQAGVLAQASAGACATDSEAAPGDTAEWLLTAAKDTGTRHNDPLTSPSTTLYRPSVGSNNFGRGLSTTLSFSIRHPVSASDLRQGWLLINSTLDGRNACWITYDVASNRISLVNDAGTGVAGSITPGVSGTAENRQCTIGGLGSFLDTSTTFRGHYSIDIMVAVTFKVAFGGTKLIYLYADDKGGLNSGWNLRGYWSVPSVDLPPFGPRVLPGSGTGTTAWFSLFFSEQDGSENIRQVWLLFNSSLDGRNACWVFYDARARQFGLVNDGGGGEAGRIAQGRAGTVENSQCRLDAAEALPAGSYYENEYALQTNFSITFKQAFVGLKTAYAYADDLGGQTIGWRTVGQWIVPTDNPQPRVEYISPSAGKGSSTHLSLRVSDPASNGNLRQAWLLLNSTLSGVNACWIAYDVVADRIGLVNSAGTGQAGQVVPGEISLAENDQCAITGVGASVVREGGSLTVRVPVRFKPAFDGTKGMYAYVDNRTGQSSGWQLRGTWSTMAANVPPTILSIFAPGSGISGQLHTAFDDPNGAADLRQGWVLVNSALSGAGACWLFFDVPSGQFGLVNDVGTAEVGRVTPGADGSVENRQCILYAPGSRLYTYGTYSGATFSVEFKASFRGLKTVFFNAVDQGGLFMGWQPVSSWTVP